MALGDKIKWNLVQQSHCVSDVNDRCTIHTKLDLHMIDAFVAVIKAYFEKMMQSSPDCSLLAKTYDLKSAYRQIPVRSDHLKYAYFCIYNHETCSVKIYRSRTLPFGATHSVYSFLRLAKMLHCVACRGPKLLTTNFYDDFILASCPQLQDSAKSCLEFVFLFAGWEYAKDGKKTTEFSSLCAALGVAFDLHDSKDGILEVRNIEKRQKVIQHRTLNRHEALKMKRKLGFAYGFLHGRVGALVLKRLVDHAYSFTNSVDDELAAALGLMVDGLRCAGPNRVDSTTVFI